MVSHIGGTVDLWLLWQDPKPIRDVTFAVEEWSPESSSALLLLVYSAILIFGEYD